MVIEAVEVIYTTEVLRLEKSLLKSKESFRFLNSVLFDVLKRAIRIYFIFQHGFVSKMGCQK